MGASLHRVLLVSNRDVYDRYVVPEELERLRHFATFDWLESSVTGLNWVSIMEHPEAEAAVAARIGDVDALCICHGSPRITAEVIAAAPEFRLIIELTGDRFAGRIDVEAVAARGIRIVDVNSGSSYPVAEWGR